MSDNRLLWVRHRKFGLGYIRTVCTAGLAVKYLLVRDPKYYRLSALEDGTLKVSEKTMEQFRRMCQNLAEKEAKANARDSGQEA